MAARAQLEQMRRQLPAGMSVPNAAPGQPTADDEQGKPPGHSGGMYL